LGGATGGKTKGLKILKKKNPRLTSRLQNVRWKTPTTTPPTPNLTQTKNTENHREGKKGTGKANELVNGWSNRRERR